MTSYPTTGTGSFRRFSAGLAWPAHRQQRCNPPDPAGLVDLGFGRSRADRVEANAAVEVDVDHLADRRRASNVEPRILAAMPAQCTKWVSGPSSFVAWQTSGRFR